MSLWPASCFWLLLFLISNEAVAQSNLCGKVDEAGVLKLKSTQWQALEGLCDCVDIVELHVAKLPLLKLPSCMAQMGGLRSLNLSKTSLVTFPPEVLHMLELEHLSIAHTRIAYLPDEVADLLQLRTLDLRGTGIEDLPDGLDHLHTIDMRLIMLSKTEQDQLRERFPNTQIFFSSPCHCN